MKKTLLIIAVVLLAYTEVNAQAGVLSMFRANYFVSENGSSSNSGKYPWAPIPASKLDSITLLPGQIVAFKRGDSFGTITVKQSGTSGKPITYTWYGTTGAKPIVNTIILDTLVYSNVVIKNIDGEKFYNKTYFVSNAGNNASNGLTPETAWASIAKVNATNFAAGDFIAFERGDVFREQLTARSGSLGSPIVYGAYGTGDNPVIEGADEITLQGVPKNAVSLNKTFNTNTGNVAWYQYRIVFTSTELRAAFNQNGTKFRLRIEGYFDRTTKIGGLSIGESDGITDDFTTAPTRLTFAGSNTVDIPAGGTGSGTFCDWSDYPIDTLKHYTVHLYINGSVPAYKYLADGLGKLFRTTSTSDQTMQQTVAFEASSTSHFFINKFEIANGTVENLYMKEAVTTKPYAMWYNDTLGRVAADTAALDINGEWFWDSGASVYYMYSSVNPNGITEVGQRGILIDASDRNNVTLQNLTLQHSNNNNDIGFGSARGAIYMFNGSNLTIRGCTIQNNSMHGLLAINSSRITIDNNTLLRNGTMNWNGKNAVIVTLLLGTHPIGTDYVFSNNNSSYAGSDGLMMYSTDYAYPLKRISIYGNTFNHNSAAGAYTIKSDTVSVYNNYFEGNGDATKAGEDYAYGSQSCSNIDVYNNTSINQLNNDAFQFWGSTAEPSHNSRIFRNHISGVINGDAIGLAPYGNQSMTNCQVFYNVFVGADDYGLLIERGDITGTADTIEVYNNTFYGNAKADVYKTSFIPVILKNNIFNSSNTISSNISANPAVGDLITSNNLYYKTSGNVLSYNGNTYTTANIATFEATAQTTNPLFTNPGAGDFTLQTGSPAINTGVNVGLTTDILGNPIVGLPDIGAYEKQP